jgi:mono/diheme cytochrome c family protein
MWNVKERHDAECETLRVPASRCPRVAASALLIVSLLFTAVGCRKDMQDQPKMKPFRASTFFRDQLSARPLVEGTVPRGWLRADTEFYTGKKVTALKTASPLSAVQTPAGPQPTAGTTGTTAAQSFPDDVDTFPFQITEDVLKRGKERYEIFCSVCHGLTGYGDGIVVRRGFRRAASFHDDRLRQAPVGHFFDAMTNGWGAMPSYAAQITVPDRWNIVAYIRALQLNQENQQTKNQTGTAQQPPAGRSPK